jgi:hypothetical protein
MVQIKRLIMCLVEPRKQQLRLRLNLHPNHPIFQDIISAKDNLCQQQIKIQLNKDKNNLALLLQVVKQILLIEPITRHLQAQEDTLATQVLHIKFQVICMLI